MTSFCVFKSSVKFIGKFEPIEIFLLRIRSFSEASIDCTSHTFFRLSQGQRKVFGCETLKNILFNEMLIVVAIQHNQNYAIYYKYKDQKVIKIIISIKPTFIRIVTFIIITIDQVPRRLL